MFQAWTRPEPTLGSQTALVAVRSLFKDLHHLDRYGALARARRAAPFAIPESVWDAPRLETHLRSIVYATVESPSTCRCGAVNTRCEQRCEDHIDYPFTVLFTACSQHRPDVLGDPTVV